MSFPKEIKIVEVGPRDGLQNEKKIISVADKIKLVELLSDTGISTIETGSFVSPKWVPQMKGTSDVLKGIKKRPNVTYSALTPNLKGRNAAITAEVDEIALFAAASETFTKNNINCTIEESINKFSEVCQTAKNKGLKVRGYISCVLGCPYEGEIKPEIVKKIALKLIEFGCYEISLGDTIGIGTPKNARLLIDCLTDQIPLNKLAVHFHDTYGQALANILTVMEQGIQTIDCSIAGLGGCPYANGATGNVATEDALYMLDGMGITTGINMNKILKASWFISTLLGQQPRSKVGNAIKLNRMP